MFWVIIKIVVNYKNNCKFFCQPKYFQLFFTKPNISYITCKHAGCWYMPPGLNFFTVINSITVNCDLRRLRNIDTALKSCVKSSMNYIIPLDVTICHYMQTFLTKLSGIENWWLGLYPKVWKQLQKNYILDVNLGTKWHSI